MRVFTETGKDKNYKERGREAESAGKLEHGSAGKRRKTCREDGASGAPRGSSGIRRVGNRGRSCCQDGTLRKQGVRQVMWRDKDIPEGWKRRKEEQF